MPELTATALVPAWNAADFIEQTLDSLAAQTYPRLRVLISVDQSTDHTAAICSEYAARDPRFTVIVQRTRLGWVGNVNALLDRAEGDYAFFAYHDDVLAPSYVARLAERLVAKPASVLAFADMLTTWPNGVQELAQYTALENVLDPLQRARVIMQRLPNWWAPHRGLFRLEVARATGGLQRHLAGEFSADWPWMLHMALHGEVVREPEVLCFKHYKGASLSRTWKFTSAQHAAASLSCLREVLRARIPLSLKARAAPIVAVQCLKELKRLILGYARGAR